MKFWQLDSICSNRDAIIQVGAGRQEWLIFPDWAQQLDELIQTQDRSKLDFELPDDFVCAVLSRCNRRFYLSDDGRLRSCQSSSDCLELSALEAYTRFGNVLEDVLEFGSVLVQQ